MNRSSSYLPAVARGAMLLLLALALTLAHVVAAPFLVGNWQGILDTTDSGKLKIVVHIKAAGDGSLTGTLDSPDQKSFGIPIRAITYDVGAVGFKCPAVKGGYTGKMDRSHQKITGTWSQAGETDLPLNLTRTK